MISELRRFEGRRNPERRSRLRFPVSVELLYTLPIRKKKLTKAGHGRTVNLSSTGVLFETNDPPVSGQRIEISIAWPVDLDNRVGLNLRAFGRTVRCQGDRVAVAFTRYEFRTRRVPASAAIEERPRFLAAGGTGS